MRTVIGTGPVPQTLEPTAAVIQFAVAARDAAGNLSPPSSRVSTPQPSSYPRSGDDTVAPSAPGNPVLSGPNLLTWTPATDSSAWRSTTEEKHLEDWLRGLIRHDIGDGALFALLGQHLTAVGWAIRTASQASRVCVGDL